jgi:uncharacterized protein (DUF58 family)
MRTTEHPLSLDDLDQQMLKKRRNWYFLALALFILSALTRQPLPLLAGFFTLLISAVPELWFRHALRHLLIRQQVNQPHLFFGEQVTLSISIENRKLLPLPWLRIDNAITPPLVVSKPQEIRRQAVPHEIFVSTWLLWSYQRVTQRYRMTCHARGIHVFGPLRLYCSDPFGWLEREILLPVHEVLVVYPLLAPIEALGLPSKFPMGEHVGPRQLLEDPLWFAGLREYQRGDDPRRIDWKATARAGELRSKIYESTTEHHLLILLDTWTYTQEIKGPDLELQEFCISAAASLATWGLDEGYTVGLLTNSAMATTADTFNREANTDHVLDEKAEGAILSVPGVSVPFALEDEHYANILTTLARLVPTGHTLLERVMETEYTLFSQGATILLIGSMNTLRASVLDQLRERQRWGCAVILVLVGDQEAGQDLPDTEDFPVYYLGGKEKWRELIRTIDNQPGALNGTSLVSLQLD